METTTITRLFDSSFNSTEHSYVIENYPSGGTERCMRRNWIETRLRLGQRLGYQTTTKAFNKLHTERLQTSKVLTLPAEYEWNKPKFSTYGGLVVMFLDSDNFLHMDSLPKFAWEEVVQKFERKYFGMLDDIQKNRFLAIKKASEVRRSEA